MKLEGILLGSETVIHDRTPMDVIKDIIESLSDDMSDDPFFMFNIADVINKLRNWKILLPRVKPFYAMLCNMDPSLLKVLQKLGIGFACDTNYEIDTILEMNVDPAKIILYNTCKPTFYLKYAVSKGVDLVVFSSFSDLYAMKQIMPNARLVLRIRCEALDAQDPSYIKFGAKAEEAFGLLKMAKKINLSVIGVSFHVGSGCNEPSVFSAAIETARKVFDQASELGHSPYLLDIGGGFAGDSNSSLDECASYINPALEKHFPEDMNVQVIAEPGRYVVASAFTLATKIYGMKEEKTADGPSYDIYITDGLYGSFNSMLSQHQIVTPTLIKEPSTTETFNTTIWGPTCDGFDKVMEDVYLPYMKEGDWFIWKDMGAYTKLGSRTFNGATLPQVHPVIPYNSWLLLQKGIDIDSLPKVEQPLQ